MKCTRCRWPYSDDIIVSPMVSSLGPTLHQGNVCGICAREMRKAVLGIDRPFAPDSLAEMAEQDAIRFRKKFPEKAPK